MKHQLIVKAALGLFFVATSVQSVIAVDSAQMESQMTAIEAEAVKSLETTSEPSKEIQSQADTQVDNANQVNDCLPVALKLNACSGDKTCTDALWEKVKRCVSRFPLADMKASFSEWLKDRYRLLRQDIERNDRVTAQYDSEAARVEAAIADIHADEAAARAAIEALELEEASMVNQLNEHAVEKARAELAVQEAAINQPSPTSAAPASVAIGPTKTNQPAVGGSNLPTPQVTAPLPAKA